MPQEEGDEESWMDLVPEHEVCRVPQWDDDDDDDDDDDESVEDVTPLQGMTPSVSGNFYQVCERPSFPPLNNQRPILVLDMNQILIQAYKADAKLAELHMSGHDTNQVLPLIAMGYPCIVVKRLGFEGFLQEMTEHYELVLRTTGLQAYAEPIVNWLDPEEGVIFSKRMYRTECTELPGGHFMKDLTRLNVYLSRVLILDNNETCYAFKPANGVPIAGFRGNNLDTEFLCGTYVSILRYASKLHDAPRHGITDEFRHCVKHTSLLMLVRSIIYAFCTFKVILLIYTYC